MVRLDMSNPELQEAASYLARSIKADSSDPLNFGMYAHFYEVKKDSGCFAFCANFIVFLLILPLLTGGIGITSV